MITIMFHFDGLLLLILATIFVVLMQRDYVHAPLMLRGALCLACLFAFSCSMHAFGIIQRSWAVAYWARIGLDLCLVAAGTARLIYGKFIPHDAKPPLHPRRKRHSLWPSTRAH